MTIADRGSAPPEGRSQAGPGPRMGRTARAAGLLYLAIFILWPLSTLVGQSAIVARGDAATTAENLAANEGLYRWSMAGQSVVFLIELVLAAILYAIFRPVSRPLSLAAAFARASEGVIMAVNLLTCFIALLMVGGAGYLAAFDREQRDALTMLAFDTNDSMVLVWGLFFAVHLALLGYLTYRSGFFPRILGILLALGGIGYFAESFGGFVAPGLGSTLETVVIVLAVPGELAFAFWLLVKGLDETAWRRANQADAGR